MTCTYSLCVPNYNYARYLGKTISSILAQADAEFEICVSDNASTDNSIEVVRSFNDPRIKLRVNQWNVGFAGNLDKAAGLASGDRMIMVSSDDVVGDGALSTYDRVLDAFSEEDRDGLVLITAREWIDADDRTIGVAGPDEKIWQVAAPAPQLAAAARAPVFIANASELLRRSLELMRTPLPFVTTCYSRRLYERVEGYGGNRLINPDKWFAWKLLTVADKVVFIDRPLFKYRWHSANQASQQAQSGALKHLVDEYVNTFDLAPETLARAGLTRERVVAAFVEQDIALRNLERVAEGNRVLARRGLRFGFAAYPVQCRSNWKVWLLRALLCLGPVGSYLARRAKDTIARKWAASEGASTPSALRAK